MSSNRYEINPTIMRENDFQLVWKDIKFVVRPGAQNEKIIINNVSGSLRSGELMAFLGPSGSGQYSRLSKMISYI